MKNHKKVIDFIRVARNSFPDAAIVYTWGGCYGFYLILKHLFPTAKAYFADSEYEHIITKIGDNFYDIKGQYVNRLKDVVALSPTDHELWEGKASGQRVEYMLHKYNEMCNKK